MNYTKGEWIADNGESELWGIFQKEDCQGIAYLCEPDGALLRPEEAEANANLIAAAPDMYEVLKMAREELCFGGDWETAKAKIGKALAKAEGNQ